MVLGKCINVFETGKIVSKHKGFLFNFEEMEQNNDIIENIDVKAVVYNFQQWISIIEPEVLKNEFSLLLNVAGYKVLNFIEHHFPNGGYTCLWLLAESHLAIHTFVSDEKTYIELSGCNKEMNIKFRSEFDNKFANYLVK